MGRQLIYIIIFMEYITIERTLYDSMLASLRECHDALQTAISRLYRKSRDEWIDSVAAQDILRRSTRTMQSLRAGGRIGYSMIEGKVFYPASEIGRLLNDGHITACET